MRFSLLRSHRMGRCVRVLRFPLINDTLWNCNGPAKREAVKFCSTAKRLAKVLRTGSSDEFWFQYDAQSESYLKPVDADYALASATNGSCRRPDPRMSRAGGRALSGVFSAAGLGLALDADLAFSAACFGRACARRSATSSFSISFLGSVHQSVLQIR